MLSQEIRRKFLQYFKDKGHTVVPSSPVVPHDDPTLLFNNAGMNQFKDVFLGKSKRDYSRATSTQKCLRVGGKHNDLDNVGHTARHNTFFEMLGNFSFGDYFKKEAIAFAWEVSLDIFKFPEEKIFITVYEEDDEAFELWKPYVPEKRITRMGAKDNYWAMGDTGPCGPCSELYFDRGEKYGTGNNPKEDIAETRYLEFWNLVFMQFNRDISGKKTPLPNQSIDTGAGLERVISLMMDVDSNFAIDIFQELIAQIEHVSGKKYLNKDPAFHVIADHIRALAFAIADGAQPSNLDRGYVLRKLLRRAVRYGKGIGLEDPFLAKVLPRLVTVMGDDFPELKDSQERISEILTLEEEAFFRTLKRGGNILSTIVDEAQKSPHKQISGQDAFKLKDTYGFPLEEILLIAKDTGLEVNLETYQLLEEQAKELSRKSQKVHVQEAEESVYQAHVEKMGPCTFLGEHELVTTATVTALVLDGQFVNALESGQEGQVLLDKTTFYAEKGGQVGDRGELKSGSATFFVTDCQTPYPGVFTHIGKVENGTLRIGDSVTTTVEGVRRQGICNHHTATHLLHWALQKVLGPHIRQAGSLVEEERLRFDFNHHKPLTQDEIREIEDLVNDKIRENRKLEAYELSFEEVQKDPTIKQFFGEKYGNVVRVVDLDYSKELCGGTHVTFVGNLGYFRIQKEGSIAAGVRRIEAVTGKEAEKMVREEEKVLELGSDLLKAKPHQLLEKITSLLEENKALGQELKGLKSKGVQDLAKSLLENVETVGSIPLISAVVPLDNAGLMELSSILHSHLTSGVLALALKEDGKCHLLVRISADLVKKGIKAGDLIKEVAPLFDGRGGGKPDLAQAGGKNPAGLKEALDKVKERLATH